MNYLFNATSSKEIFFFYKFHTVKLYEWCDAVLNSVPLTFVLGGGGLLWNLHMVESFLDYKTIYEFSFSDTG